MSTREPTIHPQDIESLYIIKDKLNDLAKDVDKNLIPRLQDLIHIINICETWCHDDNLIFLINGRDDLSWYGWYENYIRYVK